MQGEALEAITAASKRDFDLADSKIKECNVSLNKAHIFQTDLKQQEMNGDKIDVSLIVIHGQEHLMNAMTVHDLAVLMIDMYKIIFKIMGISI